MPISSTQRKVGPTPGNGTSRDFPFTFKVFDTSQVDVIRTSANGGDVSLVQPTDYVVTLNPDQNAQPGGTVRLSTALGVGLSLTIMSAVPITQLSNWQSQGGFNPDDLDDDLDRQTAVSQQLAERLGRTLVVPATVADEPIQMAKPVGSALLAWSDDGKRVVNIDPKSVASHAAYSSSEFDVFTGDGVETIFNLSLDAGSLANLRVSIAGVAQTPGEDFFWNGGTEVEFAEPPADGLKIVIQYFAVMASSAELNEAVAAVTGAMGTKVDFSVSQSLLKAQRRRARANVGALPRYHIRDYASFVSGSDWGPAFQAAFDDIVADGGGGYVYGLSGDYQVSTPVSVDLSLVPEANQPWRIGLVSEGDTRILVRTNNGTAFSFKGLPWGANVYGLKPFIEGVIFDADDPDGINGRKALKFAQTNGYCIDRCQFTECGLGLELVDVVGGTMMGANFNYCARNVKGYASSANPALGSTPNEMSWLDVHMNSTRVLGVEVTGLSQLNWIGGGFEGMGDQYALAEDAIAAGVIGFKLSDVGAYGNTAIVFYGVHFESNKGLTVFDVTSNNNLSPPVIKFVGGDTIQNGGQYTKHFILNHKGSAAVTYEFSGFSAGYQNGYTPSAARPWFSEDGAGTPAKVIRSGGVWGNGADMPAWAAKAFATTGTIVGGVSEAQGGEVGLLARESLHATSKRATAQVGVWKLIQDLGQSGSRGLSFFNDVLGRGVLDFTADGTAAFLNALVWSPDPFASGHNVPWSDFGASSGGNRWRNVFTETLDVSKYVKHTGVLVASLGTPTAGLRAVVTDSSVGMAGNFGLVVAAGGTNVVPVFADGSNWRIG